MNIEVNSNWAAPTQEPDVSAGVVGRTPDDLSLWRELQAKTREFASQNRLSKAEVARRADMAEGTFSQWYSGKYAGRLDTTNATIAKWLESAASATAVARAIPTGPAFVLTKTAAEIHATLELAQIAPDMVMIVASAGMGKSHACKHYVATRPHAFRVVMRPNTKTCFAMLVELGRALSIMEKNPAKLDSAIGSRLQRNGRQTLLIVDEAQNLEDRAIDQLRYFLDEFGCGIALTGNTSIYGRFRTRADGPDYTQINRRFGKRLKRDQPYAEDISIYIDGWGITDPDQRNLLTGIGRKPGHLGQIDKTLKMAHLMAAGSNEELALKHIQAAYQNRTSED